MVDAPPKFETEYPEEAKFLQELYAAKQMEDYFRGVGRNDKCPCGSGKKFKKCCLTK